MIPKKQQGMSQPCLSSKEFLDIILTSQCISDELTEITLCYVDSNKAYCSNISGDIYRVNIVASPQCNYVSASEVIQHYFFACPRYNDQRN